ncbi:helix-turn-helix transcriptional regulator [Robertmurraya sp. DFI.2.37]|uniref:helix-turn-helix transcriptional regulator n=1 Tax=Robertmurraya sp. DFI.2.37 TaxID=3031819 RepID=UPI001247B61E|nr:helix-turn-helix transcriptional regulator [Robertmurraya sp. DFI.2.37]MDF1510532.1 helix-turn-helix transcriptional regulator [Robertmurraya sp. DFI.2.37]
MVSLNLKQLRESKGITQTFIAKKLGYESVSSYSMIEKGKRKKIDVYTAKKIADILGVKMEDLFFENELAKKAK